MNGGQSVLMYLPCFLPQLPQATARHGTARRCFFPSTNHRVQEGSIKGFTFAGYSNKAPLIRADGSAVPCRFNPLFPEITASSPRCRNNISANRSESDFRPYHHLILILNALVAVCAGLLESVTWAVKLYRPTTVGFPDMPPVPGSSVRPGCKEPETTDQLYG